MNVVAAAAGLEAIATTNNPAPATTPVQKRSKLVINVSPL
jgi:hypothetical protein